MYNLSCENIESKYLKKCLVFFGSEAVFMYLDLDPWLSGCCARPNNFRMWENYINTNIGYQPSGNTFLWKWFFVIHLITVNIFNKHLNRNKMRKM